MSFTGSRPGLSHDSGAPLAEHELQKVEPQVQIFSPPLGTPGDSTTTRDQGLNEPFLTHEQSAPGVAHKQPSLLQSSFLFDHWLYETLSIVTSIVALIAIVVVLHTFDGLPVPEWPVGITLNAVISILSTISKTSMLTVVASCISQLKWLWFGKSRPLRDFDLYDEASRGPWGAFQIMVRPQSFHLVGLGALITLIALLIDPFTQQIVAYPPRDTPTAVASIPRAQMYDGLRSALEFGGGTQRGPEWGMKSAIYSGIFASPHQNLDVAPACPTGNCTFDPFDTLAVCGKCLNVTDRTSLAAHTAAKGDWNTWNGVYVNNYTYTLPGDFNITATALLLDSTPGADLLLAQAMVSSVIYPKGMPERILNISNPLVAFGLLQFPAVEMAGYSASYDHQIPQAWECALAFCLQTFAVTVEGNNATTELLSTYLPPQGTPHGDFFELEQTPDAVFQRPAGGPPSFDSNNTFYVPGATVAGLAQYLNHSLAGTMLTGTSEVPSGTFVDDLMQALNITTDIGGMVNNLATSMSTWIRTMDPSGPQSSAIGFALHLQVFVHVRWAWLTLPVALVILTLVLLAGTIRGTRRDSGPVWKSSSLATLFHGLEGADRKTVGELRGLKVMEDISIELRAALRKGETGDLRLMM